jgi:ketosteroid isomerase-like protein
MLWLFDADGLQARNEMFDPDRDAEALARFDELVAEPSAPRPVRRVRPNAATANAARIDAAIASRDLDAAAAEIAEETESIDHTTGASYGRSGVLDAHRRQLRTQDLALRREDLATLGDSLALYRRSFSGSGIAGRNFDVGAFEVELFFLAQVDSQGRRERCEIFPADHLGDAIARLYERYAELLPDGPERERAAATARSVAAVQGPVDLDRIAKALAPSVESADHRILGTWAACGKEALLEHFRALIELTEDPVLRDDDVLALTSGACLVRRTHLGTDRATGGSYERPYLVLHVVGADGLMSRWEHFDVDRDGEALARFDELTAAPAQPRFANAATRVADTFVRCWDASDLEGVLATWAPSPRLIDRRSLTGIDLEGDEVLASQRYMFSAGPGDRWRGDVLATRGERLALLRWRWLRSEDDRVLAEVEYVGIVEADSAGRQLLGVCFDTDALDAAYAELDARYAAGEAARFVAVTSGGRAFAAAVAARDWEALAALLAPELVVYDHRPLGWETLHGPAPLVKGWQAMVELAPDVRLRIDHATTSDRASLAALTISGTHEGGEFEDLRIIVHEYDGNGRICQHDIFGIDQLDAARARFEELRGDRA